MHKLSEPIQRIIRQYSVGPVATVNADRIRAVEACCIDVLARSAPAH